MNFSHFHEQPQKVIKVNFRDAVQIKVKKEVKKKFSNATRCEDEIKHWPCKDMVHRFKITDVGHHLCLE